MARKSLRAISLEESILDAVEQIDNADSSRVGLLDCLDNVRSILAQAYEADGSDFDADLDEKLGYGLDDEEEDDDEVEDEDEDEE